MEYKLERSKRKTLSIQIDKLGNVLVKSPLKLSENYINNFVKSKQKWIYDHKQKIMEDNKKYEDFYLLNKIIIFGIELNIQENENQIKFDNRIITFKNYSQKKSKIKSLLKKLANDYIINQTSYIARMLQLKYSSIKIISAKKKWGSCNANGYLKFNYKLAMLPKELIDYVICHELCHLKELNHSLKFWKLLENLGYEKRTIRNKMKQFGFVLNII